MTIAEDVARCIAVRTDNGLGWVASTTEPAGDAVISECGTYRYFLTRRWQPGNKGVLWHMLNPSTADASIPDATVRKVIGFSSLWGFDYAAITNTRPFRSRDPGALRRWLRNEPSMVRNVTQVQDDYVREALKHVSRVVLAWGANGIYDEQRVLAVRRSLLNSGDQFLQVGHLGLTNDGHPKHPLTLSYATPFTLYHKAA